MQDHPHHRTPAGRMRARGLGIPFEGTPGLNNAITDVPGLEVGYATIIHGEGPLVIGAGPVRTGVTAILPRGRGAADRPVFAGFFSLNGNGELTGTVWVEEAGQSEGPITITNTHSCGLARDATIRWLVQHFPTNPDQPAWGLPVAGETYDGYLNDINGFHVAVEHVFEAIDSARGGPVEEGSVGGGTGMICYEFKGGSGTASRLVTVGGRQYTVAVFVQSNFGRRDQLTIAGVPVGRYLRQGTFWEEDTGSVIAVVATDAPLMPHQLKRLARRVGLGIGRSGSVSGHGSGDIFLALSIANEGYFSPGTERRSIEVLPQVGLSSMDPLFTAVVQATDEAVVNSMTANETMTGRDGHTVFALPHDELRALLRQHGRLAGET